MPISGLLGDFEINDFKASGGILTPDKTLIEHIEMYLDANKWCRDVMYSLLSK